MNFITEDLITVKCSTTKHGLFIIWGNRRKLESFSAIHDSDKILINGFKRGNNVLCLSKIDAIKIYDAFKDSEFEAVQIQMKFLNKLLMKINE